MKAKLFVCTLLGVVGVTLVATPASAFWRLFHKHHNRHSMVIECRPYNAFTPICSGKFVTNGCCPIGGFGGFGHGDCGHMGGVCGHDMASLSGPFAGVNLGMVPMNLPPGAHVGAPMPVPGYYPTNVAPQAPAYQQPQQPAPNTQTYAPMTQGYPVQPAAYQQQYPVFYPLYPMPQQQVPAYWYGN
jgi:hypothetical protein